MINFFRGSRRQLVAGTKTKHPALITTDFFQFLYKLDGFQLDSLTEVIQFKRGQPFKPFIEKLVRMRQEADLDPAKAPLGTVAKLTANSSYG